MARKKQSSAIGRADANRPQETRDIFCRFRTYDGRSKTYSDWTCLHRSDYKSEKDWIDVCNGIGVRVLLDFKSSLECEALFSELIESKRFREYPIQGTTEPRIHFLAHEDASNDPNAFDDPTRPQPGYSYAKINLKAGSMDGLDELSSVSDELKRLCKIDKWTIGVNPILYRVASDSISPHADDDQGETLIVSLVVKQNDPYLGDEKVPLNWCRVVKIEPQRRPKHGQVMVELYLKAGDLYSMDKKVQDEYFHSVPKISSPNCGLLSFDHQRMSVIFRCGNTRQIRRDSGEACELTPKPSPQCIYGNKIESLVEGQLYSRTQLVAIGAHVYLQKGVSGNKYLGCQAIITSGNRHRQLETDSCVELVYCASYSNGGAALCYSASQSEDVRVFRSSSLGNDFRAISRMHTTHQLYRYDGLYSIWEVHVYETTYGETASGPAEKVSLKELRDSTHLKGKLCCFRLCRARKGTHWDRNQLSNEELFLSCVRAGTLSISASQNFRCPCGCQESQLCRFLDLWTDDELSHYFPCALRPPLAPVTRASSVADIDTDAAVVACISCHHCEPGSFPHPQLGEEVAALINRSTNSWRLAKVESYVRRTNMYRISVNHPFYVPLDVTASQIMRLSVEPPPAGSRCLALNPDSIGFREATVVKRRGAGEGYEWLKFDGVEESNKRGRAGLYLVERRLIAPLPIHYFRDQYAQKTKRPAKRAGDSQIHAGRRSKRPRQAPN